MFSLFSREKLSPSVTPEDKQWIESSFIWFIEIFGIDKLKARPFLFPDKETFPYDDLTDPLQFQKLFSQLCKYWEMDESEIEIKLFDDFASMKWTSINMGGSLQGASGTFEQKYTLESKRFKIQIARSNLDHPQLAVAILAHELAHVKLIGGRMITVFDHTVEPLTDLATIFFGFGIFTANSTITNVNNWLGRSGYLPDPVISYANALIAYMSKVDLTTLEVYFNDNHKFLNRQDYRFLIKTNDTLLTAPRVTELNNIYNLNQRVRKGFEENNMYEVMVACNELLKFFPKASYIYNNIAYAYLMQKEYEKAIKTFTRAIELEPHDAYPINNRGFCNLQLGNLEEALIDLQASFDMDPDNSFSYRNLGAYYLKSGDPEKALEYFIQAKKMDPKTEMIHYYLAKTYAELRNNEEESNHIAQSKEAKEFIYVND